MTTSPPSLPRPVLNRSHPSDSTLTDPSNPPSVIIDVDYRHPSSPHQTIINSGNKEKDFMSSPPKDASFYRACTLSYQSFRYQYRQFFAEFLGTFVMILLINGISAQQTLQMGSSKSWLAMSFGNGLAVLVAICISGHVSGAHLNPAVTLTFWAFSGFPRSKVPMYITAQLTGAFSGAAVCYGMIQPALDAYDGGHRQILGRKGTAGIFATFPPAVFVDARGTSIASEIIGTALLLLLIMVTGHPNNLPFCSMQGVMVAAGLMTISLALGYTSGFSLNPARDLGPRIFTAIAGWGPGVFSEAHYYALIPSFAPILGALLGGLTYTLCIDPDNRHPSL